MAQLDSFSANALTAALTWLQGALLGTVATAIAVIAVASVGFLLLTGRIDVRRGAQVVLGCFILFGASTIAGGLLGAANASRGSTDLAQSRSLPPPPQLPPPAPSQPTSSSPFDPYAGAVIPQQ